VRQKLKSTTQLVIFFYRNWSLLRRCKRTTFTLSFQKTNIMKNIFTLLAAASFSCATAQTTYVSDQFDYPAGAALTAHNWYAHSASETSPILVSASGLSWLGYIGSAIGNAANVTDAGQDINKPFSANINSGAAYASFLVKVDAPFSADGAGFFFHYGSYTGATPTPEFDNISTAFRARTFVLQGTDPDTQFKLGLAFNATTASGETADLSIGETYLVVVKYTFIAGDLNDEVSLFVFPQGADISAEPATPTLGPFTGTAADAPSLQAVCLRQYNAEQNVIVDGIFVKDVWDIEACIPTTGTDTRTECTEYTWIDGNTYDESNNTATFLIVGGAQNGCDSLVTLNLTIINVNTDVTVSGTTLTSSAQNASYQWINCNGNAPIAGALSASFTPTESGLYAVEVTQDNCTKTSECISVTVVGLDTYMLNEQISVYPNPNQGAFSLSWQNEHIMQVSIINTAGQQVYHRDNHTETATEIQLNVAPGLYFIEVVNTKDERAYQRISVD